MYSLPTRCIIRVAWTLEGEHCAPKDAVHIDVLVLELGELLRLGALTDWESDFARAILDHAKQGGSRWRPSGRQLGIIRLMAERHGRYVLRDKVSIEAEGAT